MDRFADLAALAHTLLAHTALTLDQETALAQFGGEKHY